MSVFARIQDGVVREVIRSDELPEFHPDLAAQFMTAPDEVEEGWVLADDALSPPSPPGVTELLAHSARRRWQREAGGTTLTGGLVIRTDRDSQGLILGAAWLAEAEPEVPVAFKGENGWAMLDGAALAGVARAVAAHVRAAFNKEAAVAEAIAAGTVTTVEAVDALWAEPDAGA